MCFFEGCIKDNITLENIATPKAIILAQFPISFILSLMNCIDCWSKSRKIDKQRIVSTGHRVTEMGHAVHPND